jgi:hypothetical protein
MNCLKECLKEVDFLGRMWLSVWIPDKRDRCQHWQLMYRTPVSTVSRRCLPVDVSVIWKIQIGFQTIEFWRMCHSCVTGDISKVTTMTVQIVQLLKCEIYARFTGQGYTLSEITIISEVHDNILTFFTIKFVSTVLRCACVTRSVDLLHTSWVQILHASDSFFSPDIRNVKCWINFCNYSP